MSYRSVRSVRNLVIALSFAAFATLPLAAANVSTDYDHNANFRGYHTFSFYR